MRLSTLAGGQLLFLCLLGALRIVQCNLFVCFFFPWSLFISLEAYTDWYLPEYLKGHNFCSSSEFFLFVQLQYSVLQTLAFLAAMDVHLFLLNLRDYWALLWLLLPKAQLRNFLQVVIWGICKVHLICLPFLRDPCLSLADVQYPRTIVCPDTLLLQAGE